MYCTNCGEKVHENNKFCTQCGASFTAKNLSQPELMPTTHNQPEKTVVAPQVTKAPVHKMSKEALDNKTTLGRFLHGIELADTGQLPDNEHSKTGDVAKKVTETEVYNGSSIFMMVLTLLLCGVALFFISVVARTQNSGLNLDSAPQDRTTRSDFSTNDAERFFSNETDTNLQCSISYTNWSQCNWDGVQTRFITSLGQRACTTGTQIADALTVRSCDYKRNPEIEVLKRAMFEGDNTGLASIMAKVSADILQNHAGRFEYSFITKNPLPPAKSLSADLTIHTYKIRVASDGSLEINYNLRTTNNAEPDIFDVILYDNNADGIGDAVVIQSDPLNNVGLDEAYEIRGMWISIINQYVLMYL